MAASVLAIGLKTDPAASLPLGGKAASAETAIHKVQSDKGRQGAGEGAGAGGMRFRAERGLRGDRDAESGFRERGMRRHRDRAEGFFDRDHNRRRFGRRGVIIEPGYGYVPGGCGWLRRRALATDSPYWWRRYRACRSGF
jgi:hypothetical protein